jgi:metacaspase-1
MPRDAIRFIYDKNLDFYHPLLEQLPAMRDMNSQLQASIILLSACQDNQMAGENGANGYFTFALKDVWNYGTFRGTYNSFSRAIQRQLPPIQSPNYMTLGKQNIFYEKQNPFTI